MLQDFSLKPRNPSANKQRDFHFLESKISQLCIPMVIPYGHKRVTLGGRRREWGVEKGSVAIKGKDIRAINLPFNGCIKQTRREHFQSPVMSRPRRD
jgi:hypothetical protein